MAVSESRNWNHAEQGHKKTSKVELVISNMYECRPYTEQTKLQEYNINLRFIQAEYIWNNSATDDGRILMYKLEFGAIENFVEYLF